MKLVKPIYPCFRESLIYKNNYTKPVLSQYFGENLNPKYEEMGMLGHNGIDIPCNAGTPVFASHDGTVIGLQTQITFGYGIKILSDDGTFQTIYWHLQKILVSVGQKVKAYDLIGLADSTGESTGNHLHFGYYPLPLDLNICTL